MKERPILFNGAMVRAILASTKTQTRRVLKPQTASVERWKHGEQTSDTSARYAVLRDDSGKGWATCGPFRCPYGQPGDRLWVRETWMDLQGTGVEVRTGDRSRYAYGADTPPGSYGDEQRKSYGLKWRPSIHMPRAASRITLENTSVRVERLNDISESDALAEGILSVRSQAWDREHFATWRGQFEEAVSAGTKPPIGPSPKTAFAALWQQINGPDSWNSNPWVWVVEFKRVEACNG